MRLFYEWVGSADRVSVGGLPPCLKRHAKTHTKLATHTFSRHTHSSFVTYETFVQNNGYKSGDRLRSLKRATTFRFFIIFLFLINASFFFFRIQMDGTTTVGRSEQSIISSTTNTPNSKSAMIMPTFDMSSLSIDHLFALSPQFIPTPIIYEHGIDFVDCILEQRWPDSTTATTTTAVTTDIIAPLVSTQSLPLPLPLPPRTTHMKQDIGSSATRAQSSKRVLHKCTVAGCNRAFPLKSNLKKHRESVHLKLRPHACPRCNRTFYERCKLRGHVATVHDGQRRFPCQHPGCNAAFKQNSDRKRHVREVHHGASRW